ncbi:MAG: arginine--tRNA ligase, partial [Myxococcota bacterium]
MTTIADLETRLDELKDAVLESFDVPLERRASIAIAPSPGGTKGDFGFPVFAATREIGAGPPPAAALVVAHRLAELARDDAFIAEVVAVGPYVNIVLDQRALTEIVVSQALAQGDQFGQGAASEQTRPSWVLEFSAPNTNKPQHLGHVRNNLLGESVARTLAFAGQDVTRVNLINDRGIHICKSMLMFQRHGEGKTPASTGVKGDHLVGQFYVLFNERFQQEYAGWKSCDEALAEFTKWRESSRGARVLKKMGERLKEGAVKAAFFKSYEDVYFNQYSSLGADTKEMLVAWEDPNHPDHASVRELWSTMNQWVFDGFDETYER